MKRRANDRSRFEAAAEARRRRARAHLNRLRGQRAARAPGRGPAALLLAVALAAGALLGDRVALARAHAALASIHVRGAAHLSLEQVARATGLAPGATLAGLEPQRVEQALSRHPWIAAASVAPLPGGRLLVEVRERTPVAVVAGDPPLALDETGTPFAEAGAELEALPRVVPVAAVVAGEPNADLAEAARLARSLSARGLPAPSAVFVSAPDDPEGFALQLPDLGARVVLGRGDLAAALERLARLLAAPPPELGEAASLDLRFADQAVLRETPRNGAARAAATGGGRGPSEPGPAG